MANLRRALPVALALVYGVALLGLIDLIAAWIVRWQTEVVEVAWGVVSGILVPVGLAMRRWEQVAACAVAYAGAGVLAGSTRFVVLGAGVAALAALVFSLGPTRPPLRLNPLALPAAVPFALLALHYARNHRHGVPPVDFHAGFDSWTSAASMAIALPLVSVFRTRVPARSAAVGAVLFGLVCVLYPHKLGSVGVWWSLAAIAWGAAIAATSR